MKKHLYIVALLASFNSLTNAGDPIVEDPRKAPFCNKILGHAESIINGAYDRKTSKNQMLSIFEKSGAAPYWSNETKKWLNLSINEAYKNKWSNTGYKRPPFADPNDGVSNKEYAKRNFTLEIEERCMYEAPINATYCSKQALQDSKNMKYSIRYRASLNGLCY